MYIVNPPGEAVAEMARQDAPFDIEPLFRAQFPRVARVIARLVNFWAIWCEGCQVEIPWFVQFQKKYKEQGLVVIGVSMDADGWKSVKPWLKVKKVNYPIVIGSEELGNRYGLEAMPLTALVDRDGRIAYSRSGLVNKTATDQRIRALLHESAKGAAN
jgi:thiol-disulfide isomerase/thioredoxin